jgi:hypothetical protein
VIDPSFVRSLQTWRDVSDWVPGQEDVVSVCCGSEAVLWKRGQR